MFNNDLVGKDKPWGLKKDLLPWQLSIYGRYYKMVSRCENPNDVGYANYGAKGIRNEFISLSQYYETLKKDPLWKEFKKDPSKYEIDKDIKYGHGVNYSPNTVIITTYQDNRREVMVRCRPGRNKRAVVGIDNNGGYHEWEGCYDTDSPTVVYQHCTLKYGSHTVHHGKFKDWSFYWKDEYERI